VAIAIHGEDALGGRIVNDAVGIGLGLGCANDFQGFQIENGDLGKRAVANEAAIVIQARGRPRAGA
jgi:hypothetical protein